MLATHDFRPSLVAACGLLAATLFALAFRPPKPEPMRVLAGACMQGKPAPVRPAFAIKPPALRDAEPWPRGMVMVPPETGDRIAIYVPGDDLLSALLAPLFDLVRPARPSLL